MTGETRPPGVPWSWSGGWLRRIARAVTRPECRDQGPVHDHGTSRGWPPVRSLARSSRPSLSLVLGNA